MFSWIAVVQIGPILQSRVARCKFSKPCQVPGFDEAAVALLAALWHFTGPLAGYALILRSHLQNYPAVLWSAGRIHCILLQ
jgi:hypothetical protein